MTYEEAFAELTFLRQLEEEDFTAEESLRERLAIEVLGGKGVAMVEAGLRYEYLAKMAEECYLTEEESEEYQTLSEILSY